MTARQYFRSGDATFKGKSLEGWNQVGASEFILWLHPSQLMTRTISPQIVRNVS